MFELLILTGWTVAVGFVGYSIASAKNATEIRRLRRDRYYLRKWCDRLARANEDLDLDLELERIWNV